MTHVIVPVLHGSTKFSKNEFSKNLVHNNFSKNVTLSFASLFNMHKKIVSQVCNRLVSSKAPADLSQVRHHSMPPGAGRGLPIKWPCQTACCAQRWQPSRSLCPAGKIVRKDLLCSIVMVFSTGFISFTLKT